MVVVEVAVAIDVALGDRHAQHRHVGAEPGANTLEAAGAVVRVQLVRTHGRSEVVALQQVDVAVLIEVGERDDQRGSGCVVRRAARPADRAGRRHVDEGAVASVLVQHVGRGVVVRIRRAHPRDVVGHD